MSYRDRICNWLSSCLAGKWPPWKGWFIRIDMRNYIALPESMLYIWKRPTFLLLSWYTPLPAGRAPLLLGPKCGTVANSSSRKKGLTKPGSLTNTNRIENTNIKELFCTLSAVALLPRALRVVSLQHNIGHRKDLGDPPKKYESQDLSENGFLFEECITAWISSH